MLTYHHNGREVCLGDSVKVAPKWFPSLFGSDGAKITSVRADGDSPVVTLALLGSSRSWRWKADARTGRLPWQIKFLDRAPVAAGDAFSGSPE